MARKAAIADTDEAGQALNEPATPPAADRIDRIVRAAIHAHDERFCAGVLSRLAPATRERLEALLRPAANESSDPPSDQSTGTAPALLLRLRGDPGKPSLASVQDEFAKLELVREVDLPPDLFDGMLPHELERYRRRVAAEAPYELRRHPEAARLTWLAAFVHLRERTLTDDLVDRSCHLTKTILFWIHSIPALTSNFRPASWPAS